MVMDRERLENMGSLKASSVSSSESRECGESGVSSFCSLCKKWSISWKRVRLLRKSLGSTRRFCGFYTLRFSDVEFI